MQIIIGLLGAGGVGGGGFGFMSPPMSKANIRPWFKTARANWKPHLETSYRPAEKQVDQAKQTSLAGLVEQVN